MASKGWKEHIVFPSYIGEPEEERPVFIGPLPAGVESFGKRDWEYSVNEILWKLSFTSLPEKKIPAFPWEVPTGTGGKSETYMILKNNRRAELAYAAFVQRQASDGSTLQTD
ncbi:unnamed protein product [Fusarium equiseti]|uniref:Uncharacterized protein n=1 Tax=Fusarium equiseti TaxID=61235 RepID=A0A8J2NGU0_FUSEQ|nr:unnamed protein product [Fusarium equiseti]